MTRKSIALGAIATGLGTAMTVAIAASASATVEGSSTSHNAYTDHEVVELLLDGSGRIAEENPQAAESIGFTGEVPDISDETLDDVTDELKKVSPNFHEEVTEKITSGDPYQVEDGLKSMESNLVSLGKLAKSGDISAQCAINPLVALDTLAVVGDTAVVKTKYAWVEKDSATKATDSQEVAADLAVSFK